MLGQVSALLILRTTDKVGQACAGSGRCASGKGQPWAAPTAAGPGAGSGSSADPAACTVSATPAPRQHHDCRHELQQCSTYLGYGETCRRVFAGDDFSDRGLCRRHGARDGTASAEAWYPLGQGGSPHSPGGPLAVLAADAPKESTARPRCRSSWKLAGRLQNWARAAHSVPSGERPAPGVSWFFIALGRSPARTRCGWTRTCC